MTTIRRLIMGAAVAYAAMALPLQAQQSVNAAPNPSTPATGRLLECALAPLLPASCKATLPAGQDSLPFSVRVNLTHVPAAPGDTARVTVGASRCCVQPQVANVDRNGFISVTWRAAQRSDDSVVVGFAVMDGGTLKQDSVILRPTPTPAPTPRVVTVAPTDNAYVWVRGDRIPRLIPVQITGVGGSLDEKSCESVRVLFRARMEGKVDPDSTHPVWDGSRCIAVTRWRLADDAGAQGVDVFLGGTGTILPEQTTISAFSRHTPRLTAGYGYFRSMKFEESVACEDARSLSDCEGKDDTVEVTRLTRDGRGAAFFALEMPLFLSTNPSNWVTRTLYQRTRLTIGSTFDQPEDNIFIGVTVFPLIFAASESSPFQLSAGITTGGWKAPYVGLALDASTIITPILKAVGIPGL